MSRLGIGSLGLSAIAFVALVNYEGWCGEACVPVKGDVPTIGFGTTEGVRMGDTITPPKAATRALQDIRKFEGAIKQCVQVPLHQYEYDAFLLLSYNIGPNAFCNSTLVRKLNSEDYSGACKEILRWDRFQGQPLRGLTIRRQSEYNLCIGEG